MNDHPDESTEAGRDGEPGRAWRRTRREVPPDRVEPAPAVETDAAVDAGEGPTGEGARRGGSYRMELGAAGADEARRHHVDQARNRLERLRPWLSSLLMLGAFGLALDAVAFVLAVTGAPDIVVVVLIVAFLPPTLAAWVLSLYCTIKLRDWIWAVVLGLLPLLVPVLAFAVLLPAEFVFAFPVPTLVGAVIYPWRLRHELFPTD